MAATSINNSEKHKSVNLRSIALPAEHGGWGFLLEPIVLGLLVAASWHGLLFGLGMFAVFLIHQPLKIAVKDKLKGKATPRTTWAWRFVAIYGLAAALFIVPTLLNAPQDIFIPLGFMLPLVVIQTSYDLRNKSRELLPEVAGAVALGAIAPAIAILGSWDTLPALMLWVVLAARAIPAIYFVRSIFRKQRNKPAGIPLTYALHWLAFGLVLILAIGQQLPYLSAIALLILVVRAYVMLQSQETFKPKTVGFREMGLGAMTVILTAIGFIVF